MEDRANKVLSLFPLVLAVLVLSGCQRPQRTEAPITSYLDGLEVEAIRAVRLCWRNCEEAVPVAPHRWPALLTALESLQPRPEPLSGLSDWEWICRVAVDTEAGKWLDVSVQAATRAAKRGTYALVIGGGVGADYNLFDGEPAAGWCRGATE